MRRECHRLLIGRVVRRGLRWRRTAPGRTPAARPPAARSSRSAVGAGYRDAPAVFRRGGSAQDQLAALPRGDELLVPGLMAVVKTNVSVSSRCRGEWPMTTSASA